MAKQSKAQPVDPLGAELRIGDVTYDGMVEIRKLPDGRAVMLPSAGTGPGRRRLNLDALDVLADIQREVREIAARRDRLDALVDEARETGTPWHLIGFSVGTTGEGARQRWGT